MPLSTYANGVFWRTMIFLSCIATATHTFADPNETNSAPNETGITLGMLGQGITTTNLDQLTNFYTAGLGMVVLQEIELQGATEIILGFGGERSDPLIMLYQKHNPDDKTGSSAGTGRLVLRTNDAAALAKQLNAAGYQPGEIKANSVNQMKVFWVKDPDGNPLEIVEYPMP